MNSKRKYPRGKNLPCKKHKCSFALNRHDAHRACDVLALLLPSLALAAAERRLARREEGLRRLARMALTLVVVLARFRLLFVLQVARDELASVRRTAIQVVQITIVGARRLARMALTL